MKPKGIPSHLEYGCLLQIAKSIEMLNGSNFAVLPLTKYMKDGSIPTTVLLNALKQVDDININWVSVEQLMRGLGDKYRAVLISKSGSTFILETPASKFKLTKYSQPGEPGLVYESTSSEVFSELNIIPWALTISKRDSATEVGVEGRSYVYRYFTKYSSFAVSLAFTSIVISLLGLVPAVGFQAFADKVLPNQAQSSLLVLAVVLLMAALIQNTTKCFHDFQQSVFYSKYQNGLGKEVFSRLLAMDIPYYDEKSTGDLTKLMGQINEASSFLVKQLMGLVVSLLSLVVITPVLLIYSLKLTCVVLVIGFLMMATVGLSLSSLRYRVSKAYAFDAAYQSDFIEMIKGIRTIKSLANESYFRSKINSSLEANLMGGFNIARLSHFINALVSFQSQLIPIAIIFFGANAVFAGEMTIGQLIAFNMIAGNLVEPMMSLVMTANSWETFKLAKKRLEELQPKKVEDTTLLGNDIDLNGSIEFDDVWFRYPEKKVEDKNEDSYILRGVSFKLVGHAVN